MNLPPGTGDETVSTPDLFLASPMRLDRAMKDPRAFILQPVGIGQLYMIVHIASGMAYIGLNIDMTLRDRLYYHGKKSSGCIKIRNALRCHGYAAFTVQLIDRGITEASVPDLEAQRILEHKTLHPDGYNLTLGGKTSPMKSEVVRQKQKATKASVAGFARSSAASKKNQACPDVIQRKREGMIASCATRQGTMSATAKLAMNRPEVKARHKAACNTPTGKKNRGDASRKSHADPESKARRSQALKDAWVVRKAKYGGSGFKKQ